MSAEVSGNTIDTAIYIHWPFCLSKCPYCDFNVHVHDTIDQSAWKSSYIKALKYYTEMLPDRRIVSVFFGGGTPSLMPVDTVEEILKTINDNWSVAENVEVTLEANPTSVEIGKFKGFRAAGVNRVSLGVQSLEAGPLEFLGRKHTVAEALQAIDIAGQTFDRFSFDLIYALPNQTVEEWQAELKKAVQYARGHMSLYQLTIERSTPFYMAHAQGKFTIPEQELAADFYHVTQRFMESQGLPAYEVSNHAAPGQESIHNKIYWEYGDYIGIGPGAHGRLTLDGHKHATRDHSAPQVWLDDVKAKGHGAHPYEKLAPRDKFLEALMMGLRIKEGITLDHLRDKSGVAPEEALDNSKLEKIMIEGWLYMNPGTLQLTREGWLRLNAIVPFILKDGF